MKRTAGATPPMPRMAPMRRGYFPRARSPTWRFGCWRRGTFRRDDLRVSPPAFEGLQGCSSSGDLGAGDGDGTRLGIDGTAGEREPAQGDELCSNRKQAQQQDGEEDEPTGTTVQGDELPEESLRREDRLAATEAVKQRLEAAQRAANDERGRKPGQDRNPKGGVATSGPTGNQRRSLRATSPTPRARS